MSKWEQTPFEDLDQAHTWASQHGHVPSDIEVDEEHQLRHFRTKRNYVLAQELTGGGVFQKYSPRTYKYEKQKRVGPWVNSQYRTLEDVQRHYRDDFPISEQFEVETIMLVRYKKDEIEYIKRKGRVYTRVIHEATE